MSTNRLPDNVVTIWTPQDAIDTAQAFHREMANAERGNWTVCPTCARWVKSLGAECARCRRGRWLRRLFGRSRFRRARILDALAVALLMALMAAFGVIVYTASARADGATDAWTAEYGPAACSFLEENSTMTALSGIVYAAEQMGLTPEQAGEAVATSVYAYCPENRILLHQFVARFGAVHA